MSAPEQLLRQFTFSEVAGLQEIAFFSRSSGFLSPSYFYWIDIIHYANPKMMLKNLLG